MLNDIILQTKIQKAKDIRLTNLIACQIDNFKVNLNQFELNFSDQDVLRKYSSKLATIKRNK